MLVWVDETGSDSRDNAWRYGYTLHSVKQLLKEAGILVLFLPPYSPDKDPLEEAAFASITPDQKVGLVILVIQITVFIRIKRMQIK